MTFQKVLSEAKEQLPNAFRVGGQLPYSREGVRNLEEIDETSANPLTVNDVMLPTGDEDVGDLQDALTEIGVEALAIYVSFHRPTADGQWGIFYFQDRMRQLAELIRRDLGCQRNVAAELAFVTVKEHEQYHFRFDVYALYHELILGRPLYNPYSSNVFRAVYCTPECFEEALATSASLHVPYRSYRITMSVDDTTRIYAFRAFFGSLMKKCPPGYRDFDKPKRALKSRLGGQLLLGRVQSVLAEPQAAWLPTTGKGWRPRVPQAVIQGQPLADGKSPRLTFRLANYVWRFHKTDPDPWPSTPHAHDYEHGVKLDIRDGTIYHAGSRKRVDQIKRRVLIELREQLGRNWRDVALPPITGRAAAL